MGFGETQHVLNVNADDLIVATIPLTGKYTNTKDCANRISLHNFTRPLNTSLCIIIHLRLVVMETEKNAEVDLVHFARKE